MSVDRLYVIFVASPRDIVVNVNPISQTVTLHPATETKIAVSAALAA